MRRGCKRPYINAFHKMKLNIFRDIKNYLIGPTGTIVKMERK